jgi:AcrR family transcriptional regulator
VEAAQSRIPLTRERVLLAAVELADTRGIEALTMRNLGQELGVEAMSLYKHVADKEDILDGVADRIAAGFEVPSRDLEWREALRRSAISAHAILRRHPWASTVIESRSNLGPARLRYVDAVIGVMAAAGFPLPVIGRAFMALDSHIYGFTLQEAAWTFEAGDPAAAEAFGRRLAGDDYPNILAMTRAVGDDPELTRVDFTFGLDILLDGLEALRPKG